MIAELMGRFNDVFQRHDPSALAELVGEDCTIENTDGTRHAGRAACIALWTQIATAPGTSFDLEETRVLGDHAVFLWRFHAEVGSVRGLNLMRVREGRIVEAKGYVKNV